MPIRSRRRNHLTAARDRLVPLRASPLVRVVEKLEAVLESVDPRHCSRTVPERDLAHLDAAIKHVIDSLPSSFGRRFMFDAALIQSMAEDLGPSDLLSSFIVPRYHAEWGHASLPLPTYFVKTLEEPFEKRAPIIDIVLMPGEDQVLDVDLLDYAWIAHELGHHLLFRNDEDFTGEVQGSVRDAQSRLRLAAIADRGRARSNALSLITQAVEFWSPSPDHRNWSHELAADLLGVWVLGDAYLETFADFLESSKPNPFQIGPVHPPYAVRAEALARCGDCCTFRGSATRLSRVSAQLKRAFAQHRSNQFDFLADGELIEAVAQASFRQFKALELQKCAHWVSTRDQHAHCQRANQQFGIELLISARTAYRSFPDHYDEWETQVVDDLARSVTL